MLSDSDIIDKVNPYLDDMPGAWSAPYTFSGYMKLDEEPEVTQDPSPACDMASTAGDKQVDWCKPGEPNCPMSRELEPTQKVDSDISYKDRGDVMFGADLGISSMLKTSLPRKMDMQFLINVILLLMFLIFIIRLAGKL